MAAYSLTTWVDRPRSSKPTRNSGTAWIGHLLTASGHLLTIQRLISVPAYSYHLEVHRLVVERYIYGGMGLAR
jgi:hypothetical protein